MFIVRHDVVVVVLLETDVVDTVAFTDAVDVAGAAAIPRIADSS